MGKKNSNNESSVIRMTVDDFLQRYKYGPTEFVKEMGGNSRGSIRYWRENYLVEVNEQAKQVSLVRSEAIVKTKTVPCLKEGKLPAVKGF